MYAIAILRYRRSLDEVLTVLDEHRAYLRVLQERGLLLASGAMQPRHGGLLLLRVPDAATLDRVRDDDPFTRTGVAQYELIPWAPTIGLEALDAM
ncbi:MAG TPA: YciI family protein [Gemmatimonadaceae bacterium]|nr:YciI family protein [Gemmatimonadaceae bacterium]